jgi:hypothetical protein
VLTRREKILFDGEYDWVKLKQVHDYVALENPSASLAEVSARRWNWCDRWPRKA